MVPQGFDLHGRSFPAGNRRDFSLADIFKAEVKKDRTKLPYLCGKTVVNLFFEPSTRTRTAFEMAAHKLGADVISFSSSISSSVKGETLKDTAKT